MGNRGIMSFISGEQGNTSLTNASAQRVTNTPGRRHFLIIKYFKVNDNDTRQAIVTDLSFQEQLSWSK